MEATPSPIIMETPPMVATLASTSTILLIRVSLQRSPRMP